MSAFPEENKESEGFIERRMFPRVIANCPVLYRLDFSERWHVAKMVDYSATGIRISCDENLPVGTKIAIQIKPGSIKTIPPVSAEGQVARSEVDSDQHFVVSVKILKVERNS
jgi:hypothetical protein